MRSMPRRTSHMPETAHHNGKTTMHVESIAQKLMHAAIEWLTMIPAAAKSAV